MVVQLLLQVFSRSEKLIILPINQNRLQLSVINSSNDSVYLEARTAPMKGEQRNIEGRKSSNLTLDIHGEMYNCAGYAKRFLLRRRSLGKFSD
mmetsp:Transcript_14344/g.17380  ORF Transcript_14344/g.17380 Transcript_14344/m.17380 type:complete len:93 (+) Transcript_14344:314-592(+)